MLITRFYTAFFLLGILIPTFIWAPFDILRGLVALGMAICAWEWSRLFQLDSWLVKMYASAVGATVFFLLDIRFNFFIGLLYYSACFWLFFVPFLLWKHPLLRSRIWCFFS